MLGHVTVYAVHGVSFGIVADIGDLNAANAAAVVVTADLKPFMARSDH